MRFCAFSAFQPWVTTWLKSVWPETTFEGAVVDLRLEHLHGAVEEDLGVGVVGRAGEELDVVRALAGFLAHAVEQGLALQLADLEVVVGHVVVDVRACSSAGGRRR